MAELRQYVPLKVVGSWDTNSPLGVIDILDGTIDGGEFAATETDNPTWSREHDRHGNATRVKNSNKGGRQRITFSASSPTNDALSRAVALDDTTDAVVGPIVLKDLNGNTRVVITGAFLVDTPDPSFGSDRGSRVWVWECATIDKFIGGHDLA